MTSYPEQQRQGGKREAYSMMSSTECDTLTSLDTPWALGRYVLPPQLYVLPRTGNISDVASSEPHAAASTMGRAAGSGRAAGASGAVAARGRRSRRWGRWGLPVQGAGGPPPAPPEPPLGPLAAARAAAARACPRRLSELGSPRLSKGAAPWANMATDVVAVVGQAACCSELGSA